MQEVNRTWLEGMIAMLVDLIEEGDEHEGELLRERAVIDDQLAAVICNREVCKAHLVAARALHVEVIGGVHRSPPATDLEPVDPRQLDILPADLFGPN